MSRFRRTLARVKTVSLCSLCWILATLPSCGSSESGHSSEGGTNQGTGGASADAGSGGSPAGGAGASGTGGSGTGGDDIGGASVGGTSATGGKSSGGTSATGGKNSGGASSGGGGTVSGAGAGGTTAGGSAGSPDIPGSTPIVDLDNTQKGALCDWNADVLGGYGHVSVCAMGSIVFYADQAECISKAFTPYCMRATVGQFVECVSAKIPSSGCDLPWDQCRRLYCM